MKLVVCADKDAASVNITEQLLRLGDWQPAGEFEGTPAKRLGDSLIVTIPVHHLCYDDIDDKVEKALGARPSLVIFASRHKSASNMRTLTIHPIGNFGKAEMGGRDRTLVPAAPHEMTFALKELAKRACGLKYQVSLEATHHGPYLQTPTFYIEIGSDEEAWKAMEPGRAIAGALFEVLTSDIPQDRIAVGVGGGHYVPRITDVAREKRISFGHILPSYAFEEGLQKGMLENMLGATPGTTLMPRRMSGIMR
jgi:D-aminoacyl-tRNA deacylase